MLTLHIEVPSLEAQEALMGFYWIGTCRTGASSTDGNPHVEDSGNHDSQLARRPYKLCSESIIPDHRNSCQYRRAALSKPIISRSIRGLPYIFETQDLQSIF